MSKACWAVTRSGGMNIARFLIVVFCYTGLISSTLAYEHQNSLVNFEEYTADIIAKSRQENKPYFLLFSAEWCHWCHEFAQNTLTRPDVAAYLNRHYVNVFIDVDIHNSAYVKYRATGLPYTVFLNPDGSIYYKYTGTLYGDAFLDVINEVANSTGVGKYALGMEAHHASYAPPSSLTVADLEAMPETFMQGVLDNFDSSEYGLGKGQKSIQPRTFLYLLERADVSNRERAVKWIGATLERAIERIYDPLEGGFFRYAETRNWQVPHYEKFADLNAGSVLLLYQINRASPRPTLKQAADTTLAYLTSTLFDAETGTFLNFQVADTHYYFLDRKQRKIAQKPKVMDKIFTDRLAVTLNYLIQVLEFSDNPDLQNKVRSSLEFLTDMVSGGTSINRYYAMYDKKWMLRGGLSDHAYLVNLLTNAASRFQSTRYADLAAKVVRAAIAEFYDEQRQLFVDPTVDSNTNIEYLMEMNGLIARSMIELENRLEPRSREIVKSLITHFSLMGEVLEDRFWEARDWEFTEAYVPYLQALDNYTARN